VQHRRRLVGQPLLGGVDLRAGQLLEALDLVALDRIFGLSTLYTF